MSFYTFAEANLTTAHDRKWHPVIDKGQVVRIVAFWLTFAAALVFMAHRQGHAAGQDSIGNPIASHSAGSAS